MRGKLKREQREVVTKGTRVGTGAERTAVEAEGTGVGTTGMGKLPTEVEKVGVY